MPPTKRPRCEQSGGAIGDLLEQLICANPEALVKAAFDTDAATFAKLFEFSEKLSECIERHKKSKLERERAAKEALKQKEWGRLKAEKREWVASHKCFVCKKTADVLEPCTCFKESGTGGDGVVVCEDCQENENYMFCPDCSSMISKSCCDTSHKCSGCGEITCLFCAEKEDFEGNFCDDCGNFFCPSCTKENLEEEKCCSCSRSALCCENCSGFPECEGECGLPLCDNCQQFTDCGHEQARICGKCDYICEQCMPL